jgi:hypothetical protein
MSAPPECCIAGADGQSWPCRSMWLLAFHSGSVVRDAPDFRILGREQQSRDRDDTTGPRPRQRSGLARIEQAPAPPSAGNQGRQVNGHEDHRADDAEMHEIGERQGRPRCALLWYRRKHSPRPGWRVLRAVVAEARYRRPRLATERAALGLVPGYHATLKCSRWQGSRTLSGLPQK